MALFVVTDFSKIAWTASAQQKIQQESKKNCGQALPGNVRYGSIQFL